MNTSVGLVRWRGDGGRPYATRREVTLSPYGRAMNGLGYVSIKLPLRPLKKRIIRGLRGTFVVVTERGVVLPNM
jgi:hypothetical protein